MTRKTLVATATAIFAAGIVTAAHGQSGSVKCAGINSCKGTSACKSANSACKGQNACKGQGWTQTTDVVSCTTRGGKAVE
jgi:hypothetical protein